MSSLLSLLRAAPPSRAEPTSATGSDATRKSDLALAVALRTGTDLVLAKAAVSAVLDCISAELSHGRAVTLQGFGRFEVLERAPRRVRHPGTGDLLAVPKRRAVRFRPAAALGSAPGRPLGKAR